MAEHHSESLYMTIFYYLLALTVLEILVALLAAVQVALGRYRGAKTPRAHQWFQCRVQFRGQILFHAMAIFERGVRRLR